MHIKNIIISDFRSYRSLSFNEDLSPKHNVLVGRNGSGKSNFFAAIQFVLSEKFANLRANERKELFHVGAGRPALSVYVEIVFDNSEGRVVIPGRPEEPEIRIRRTLGLKQDEFRVNDRKFTASEVRQLLESAGFSATNPYYIVEQGKIVNLASMKEEDRYQLLKDVAGTKVYEARRQESETLLSEAKVRQRQIDAEIQKFDNRLKELEAETKELKAFQEADKKRRSLEFCIFNSDLNAAKDELDRLDANWSERLRQSDVMREEEDKLEEAAKAAELAAQAAAKRQIQIEAERKRLEKERAALFSRRAIAKLRADDAAGVNTREQAEVTALKKEASELEKAITKATADLASRKKLHATAEAAAAETSKRFTKDSVELEVLQAKRGRKQQFSTKAERDQWIREEVKRNTALIATNKKEIQRVEEELKQVEEMQANEKSQATKHEKSANSHVESLEQQDKEREEALTKRDNLNAERRKLWQEVNRLEGLVRRSTDEFNRAKQRMDKATRNDIRQGLQSLAETLNEMNDPRIKQAVHGQIIELMTFDAAYQGAIEVSVGNALFNVVVDSFDISAKILEHMNKKRKPGRVTFFPLDTCKGERRAIPTTADCSPLLSHVAFDKRFNSVFCELFGRTAVAKTLDIAARLVKELDCDVVTIDGDQFNRKGGITGGYVDKKNMKLSAFAEMLHASKLLHEDKEKLDKQCQVVAALEQQITEVLHHIDQANSQEAQAKNSAENARREIRFLEDRLSRLERQMAQLKEAKSNLERANVTIAATTEALNEEVKTEFKVTLTAGEEKRLEELQKIVSEERVALGAEQSQLVQLATEVQLLIDTHSHLEHRQHTVRDRIAALARPSKEVGLQYREMVSLDEEIKVMDARLAAIDGQIEAAVQERRKNDEESGQLRARLLESSRQQQDKKELLDKAHNKRALLLQKKEDAQAKIRRLGVIPADHEQYAAHSIGKLMHMLRGVNEELRKYAHVNKKALDQYSALDATRTDLGKERKGLDKELESIHTLIAHLDTKKDEAIERTYKQVQHEFEQVFRELVQAEGSSAELLLVQNPDRAAADPFIAVRIKVSFGLGLPPAELAQLSGGQKSLVALALIFAIQRCDPAPFYLFDEIDAALDAEFRLAVAGMLQRQSEGCQFITASFKTEMLNTADHVYGIFFHNKVSRIERITYEEGARLLKQAAAEDRKRPRDERTTGEAPRTQEEEGEEE